MDRAAQLGQPPPPSIPGSTAKSHLERAIVASYLARCTSRISREKAPLHRTTGVLWADAAEEISTEQSGRRIDSMRAMPQISRYSRVGRRADPCCARGTDRNRRKHNVIRACELAQAPPSPGFGAHASLWLGMSRRSPQGGSRRPVRHGRASGVGTCPPWSRATRPDRVLERGAESDTASSLRSCYIFSA